MKRIFIGIAVALAALGIIFVIHKTASTPTETPTPTVTVGDVPSATGAPTDKPGDPKNGTYDVGEGNTVTLVNGVATLTSGTDTATIRYADGEAKGDMDADGKADTAFIMTAEVSTGGQFSILALILGSEGGVHHVLPSFLGSKIKFQSAAISDGTLTVRYLDHKDPTDITTPPTLQVTKQLKLQSGQFVEVVPAKQ